jgi:tRNA-Thr(GGU) m(6)t(6)A37 methyltransferase TsaA
VNQGVVNVKVKSIGIIHTPFKCKKDTPIQPFQSKAVGEISVFKEYQEGLEGIEGFSHLILLYRFHKSRGYCLKVKPFLDNKLKGLFATRYPRRPNQIGLSVVKLIKRNGRILLVSGVDMIDNTPLLDIKPFIPDFNRKEKIRIGWLTKKLR